MRPRSIAVAVTLAIIAALAALDAQAATTPPAGTPDLALMTVQPADLAAGARVTVDDYVAPPANFTAEYARHFTNAQPPGGGPTFALDTELALARSSAVATVALAGERRIYGTKAGHQLIASALIAAAGSRARIRRRDVHFSKIVPIAAGSGSFYMPVRVRVNHRSVFADFSVLGEGTIVANLTYVSLSQRLPTSLVAGLATAVTGRIASVLAGATGSSGPTGTS